jgi:uncharacterized MAPEG superfamily protein
MTVPLWMLLGFAVWTLLILVAGIGVYRWLLIFQGRAQLTSFPGDVAHGSVPYRRAVRAHANCLENLPVFAALVLIGQTAHLSPPHMDGLAVTTFVARIAQSCIHTLLPETNASIAARFSCLLVQLLAMGAMAALLAMAALAKDAP